MAVYPVSLISALLLFIEPLRFRANMFLGKSKIPQLIDLPKIREIFIRAGEGTNLPPDTHYAEHQAENLSGRKGGLISLWENTIGSLNWQTTFFGPYGVIPRESYETAGEILYVFIFTHFGLIGLVLWSLPFLLSLHIFFYKRHDYIMRGVLLGLAAYFLTAVFEGAYWLPPTAFNLWFIVAVGWVRTTHLQVQGKDI